MSQYYYQVRKKKTGVRTGLLGVALMVLGAVLLSSVVAPSLTGRLGAKIHSLFDHFSGWPSFLIPAYMVWMGFQNLSKEKKSKGILGLLFFSLALISLCALFSLSHTAQAKAVGGAGGRLGDYVSLFLMQQFGVLLTALSSLLVLFASATLLAGVSPVSVLLWLKEKIEQDLALWKMERKRLGEEAALKKKIEATSAPKLKPESKIAEPPSLPAGKPKINMPEDQIDKSFLKPSVKEAKKAAEPEAPKPVIASSLPGGTVKEKAQAAGPAKTEEASAVTPAPPPVQNYDGYRLPDPDLLTLKEQTVPAISKEELYANGTLLEQTLEQFGVKAKVIDIHPGPVITRYDLTPAPGVRVQAIETLSNDIALAMKAQSLRVLAPIPGKGAVGIEISNPHPAIVYFKEIILSTHFQKAAYTMPLGLGKATEGHTYVADLVSTPHLLIAGATGSGKSVCIHSVILSILFRFRPDEVKMLLIDPKRLELPVYDSIPHLYNPAVEPSEVRVITEPKEVVYTLKKLIEVMDDRYRTFAKYGVRNIDGYNEKMKALNQPREAYIIVIIDELADLMVIVGREVEDSIQRLAQMARAVGIHLILATQRPSVDVITGVIKANLPSRVAFQVLSKTDSRVILDSQGAEDLLGKGDMLYLASNAPKPVRLQGAYVSEADVSRVVQFIREQNFKPQYVPLRSSGSEESVVDGEDNRRLLVRAARVVRDTEKVSGDLLRADKEIGSRYDWALTLLRKKGLIEKPKDSNRWKIHFDRLNDFLDETDKDPDPGL